jgi:hypothetical protein
MHVNVTRRKIASRGHGYAWYWHHYATGPDGARFDNRSIVTLRQVLRRRYGASVKITESWKGMK